jgi:parallel beta-helix repeat protein
MQGEASTISVFPGDSIQMAIDEALPGDTIEVQKGIYYENINITKPIILQGLDRPVVDALGMGSAIAITASGVTLRGFEAVNSGGRFEAGINVKSDNNLIEDNKASENHEIGIYLDQSNNNVVRDNEAIDNIYGIALANSHNNTFRNNSLRNNDRNFLAGSKEGDLNDIDTSNTIDEKPIYYLVNQSDLILDASSNAADIYCTNCRNITVRDLTLENNYAGIHIINTTESRFINNTMCNNIFGIYLLCSSRNLLAENTAKDNSYGIFLDQNSFNNTLISNKASGNEYGVFIAGIGGASRNDLLSNNTIAENSKGDVFSKHRP